MLVTAGVFSLSFRAQSGSKLRVINKFALLMFHRDRPDAGVPPERSLEDLLDGVQDVLVKDDVQMSHALELGHVHGLLLLSSPALALTHAQTVHRVVPVGVDEVHRVGVGELLVVDVGHRGGQADAVEAVDLDAGRGQTRRQVPRVLPHVPTILEMNIVEKSLVVPVSVVEGRCGDEDVIVVPDVHRRDHPGVGGGHALLLADLDGRHERDAVVVA